MSDFDHQTPAAAFLVLWMGFVATLSVVVAAFAFTSNPLLGDVMMVTGIAIFILYLVLLLDYITPQIGESHR